MLTFLFFVSCFLLPLTMGAPMVLEAVHEDSDANLLQSVVPTREVSDPSAYSFQYNNQDDYGAVQHREENKSEDGVVRGSYGYRDQHGIYRHVSYVADSGGFHAVVRTNEPGMGNRNSADVAVVAQVPKYSTYS